MNLLSSNQDYSAQGLFGLCDEISRGDVKPGDLFFRQNGSDIYHVGVAVEGGEEVEAISTRLGVIRRTLPVADRYGRLRMLQQYTTYDVPPDPNPPANIPTTQVPTSYVVTTTYDVNSAPLVVKDNVQELNGNLLFYRDDCVLYNVGVESDGGTQNELVLYWAPIVSSPTTLNLGYEVLVY
jgi:cell wall-associated NlpC family hydrolase